MSASLSVCLSAALSVCVPRAISVEFDLEWLLLLQLLPLKRQRCQGNPGNGMTALGKRSQLPVLGAKLGQSSNVIKINMKMQQQQQLEKLNQKCTRSMVGCLAA